MTTNFVDKTLSIILIIIIGLKAEKNKSLIYILEWTGAGKEPFNYLGSGQQAFIERNCEFQNCYLTEERTLLDDLLDYDVLLFNAFHVRHGIEDDLPPKRSEAQEYILVALEPATFYPVSEKYNGFFNMTWTYKLASDIPYPYIQVKNNRSEIIGPRKNIKWLKTEEMALPDEKVISKLKTKSKAAVWIASNCYSKERLRFIKALNWELRKYDRQVDIFGKCGDRLWSCPRDYGPRDYTNECYKKVETDYYFYMAFENTFCEDYVSEKLIYALHNYAVPIVYGGANYSRFLPDGIYLNALELGVSDLAKEMNDIINFPPRYEDFFRWHGYYTFEGIEHDNSHQSVCGFCALLNNKTRRQQRTYYKNITKWWNEWGVHKQYPTLEPEPSTSGSGVLGFIDNLYSYYFESD